MKTLLKRNFESTVNDDFFVPLTIGESRESNSSDFMSYVFFKGCSYSSIKPARIEQISHHSGLLISNFIITDHDSELTRHSMELSMNSFRELWENEDDNYWNQYI